MGGPKGCSQMSTLQHLREQLALSGRVVPLSSLRRVSSLAFLAACAAVVAASLAFFTLAEALIMRRDSSCSAVATTVLDKRFGYSPDAAAYALECWGSLGRAAFLIIEAVDVVVYMPAYRGGMVVLVNRGLDSLGAKWGARLAWAAALPVWLAVVDVLEDALQVAITVLYGSEGKREEVAGSVIWRGVAWAAASVNVVKWVFLGVVGPVLVLSLLAALAGAVAGKGSQKGAGAKAKKQQ